MRRELILDTGVAETDNQPHASYPFQQTQAACKSRKIWQAASKLLLLRILGIGSRSSSRRCRSIGLALLGNLWLRRSDDHLLHSHNLFLDDRDVRNCRVLVLQELDAARVRQVRNVNQTMQLKVRNIDIQMARNIAWQALDLNLAQDMLEDAALRLYANRNANKLNRDRNAHQLVHSDPFQVHMQYFALD